MPENVRAMVLKAPGKYELSTFPYPKPEKGAAIVKMIMSGICGTDKHSYKGEDTQYGGTKNEVHVPYPIIQGHENVGIIEEIDAEGAKNLEFNGEILKVGDRVTWSPDVICGKCYECRYTSGYSWCQHMQGLYGNGLSCESYPHLFGGFSEYCYIMPGAHVFKVPEELSDECAMLAEIMSCSWNVDKAKEFYSFSGEGFQVNATVVVIGVGPLGMSHLIKANILGAGKIIAMDTSDYKLNMAKDFGATHTLNVTGTTIEERVEFVEQITKGRGADLVIECVGRPQMFADSLKYVRKGGMVLEPGNFVDAGDISISPHIICAKNIRIIGQSSLVYTAFTPAMDMMINFHNRIPFEKMVSHHYGLEQTEEAILKSMAPDSMKVAIHGNK